MQLRRKALNCPSIVPVARYSAHETAWHTREKPILAACRVEPVATAVLVVSAAVIYTGAVQEEILHSVPRISNRHTREIDAACVCIRCVK